MRQWLIQGSQRIKSNPLLRRALRRLLRDHSAERQLAEFPLKLRFPAAQHFNLFFARRILYEPRSIQELRTHLPSGGVCFDVGGNVGIYTIIAAHLVGPTGQVHVFEPDPQSTRWLEQNIALNGQNNVVLHACAVGAEAGTAAFHQDTTTTRTGSLSAGAWTPDQETRPQIQVEVVPLDAYLNAVTRVDLMKIDVEGFEYQVLQGARQLLRTYRPTLLLELSAASRAECGRLLQELGYERAGEDTGADSLMQLWRCAR